MRKLLRQLPLLIIWLIVSAVFWGWIFTFITDTSPDKKISVMIDAQLENATELAVKLEEIQSDTIRMVKVHPFSYALMGSDAVANADLLIIAEANLSEYSAHIMPVPEELGCTAPGIPLGKRLDGYIAEYCRGIEYYLCFGKNSVHIEDGEAVKYARAILNLD